MTGGSKTGRRRGFTLIELIIVVTLIALVSSVASFALRDPASTRLEREGARLAALLESARAESRSLGSAVIWLPMPYSNGDQQGDFRFVGLPEKLAVRLNGAAPEGLDGAFDKNRAQLKPMLPETPT